MGRSQREKGKRGELEFAHAAADEWGSVGARRSAQFAGGVDSADVINVVPGVHFEVKRCERLSLYEAVEQARRDSGDACHAVAHRRNRKEWLVVVPMRHVEAFVASFVRMKGRVDNGL